MMINEIEYPTDSDIKDAILKLKNDSFEDVKLTIGDKSLSVFVIDENSFHVIFSECGKMFENENILLSRESVIEMFLLLNRNDSLKKNMSEWRDVTSKTKKCVPVFVFLANSLILFGFVWLVLAFAGNFKKALFWLFVSLGIVFPFLGSLLHLIWHWKGPDRIKAYPVLLVSNNDK